MDWKLKENIRLDKICDTCLYGTSFTGKTDITLCLFEMIEMPDITPRIRTCNNWKTDIK